MAGTLRDYRTESGNLTRGPLTTSSSANEPDVIIPPTAASYVTIKSTTTALEYQRDAVASFYNAAGTVTASTLTSGSKFELVADALIAMPLSGQFAVASAGTSVTYYLCFYDKKP